MTANITDVADSNINSIPVGLFRNNAESNVTTALSCETLVIMHTGLQLVAQSDSIIHSIKLVKARNLAFVCCELYS